MDDKYCVNAAAYTRYFSSDRKMLARERARWLGVESTDYIRPGSKVDKLLFIQEPERVVEELRWGLYELTEERIVFRMGVYHRNLETQGGDNVSNITQYFERIPKK